LSFLSAEWVEFCGWTGFEWLFLDAQRTRLNPHLCCELVRAASLVGMFCLVRVKSINDPEIEGYLDTGVLGILAPNISTAAQAQALVAAVKFSPTGSRAAASRSRAARYGLTQSPSKYYHEANEHTFCAALIETEAAINNIDSILTVPGLDYLAIGTNDLALSLGSHLGNADPRVRAMVEHVSERIQAAGKPQIAVAADADLVHTAAAQGACLIAVPDIDLVGRAARSFLQIARRRETMTSCTPSRSDCPAR